MNGQNIMVNPWQFWDDKTELVKFFVVIFSGDITVFFEFLHEFNLHGLCLKPEK